MKQLNIKFFSIILISSVGILVYSNTFHCSFHFDDIPTIVDNSFIRNIQDLHGIWIVMPCRFITFLSIAFNYHFNGLNVFGYHLFNLMVHLSSAILVWWLTLLTLSTPAMKEERIARHANLISLCAGLVFVSHPLQTEAVTYIWQRAASLATLFYVTSLCFYVKSRLVPSLLGRFYYVCSLTIAIVAMFTKEIAITLPLMILLYEFSFLRTEKNLNWKYLFPFLMTIFIIPLTMLFTSSVLLNAQQMQGIITPMGSSKISSVDYLLTQFRVMVTYIRLLLLPLNQNLDYNYPIFKNIFELPVLFSCLFLIIVLFSAKRLFSRYRLVSFSIFWFFLTLLPESSFFPIKDVIFEHRLYLPLVGYSLFLVSGAYYILGKTSIKMMVIVLMIIVVYNSVLTYERNKVWKNDLTLWDDTVQKSPHKARAYSNRGLANVKLRNFTQAMSDYTKAIEIDPSLVEAYNGRGAVYLFQGNLPQAISDYTRAIELNPIFIDGYFNRGRAYSYQNKFSQAISDYSRVIEINLNNAEAYKDRGNIYYYQKNSPQAIFNYTQVIKINPNDAGAYYNRGLTYYYQKNFLRAIVDYTKAIETNPQSAVAYNNRGYTYAKQGKMTQAITDLNKAIEINPHDAAAYYSRGFVYFKEKEYDRAWADVHKADTLGYKPDQEDSEFINDLKKATLRSN